MVYRSDRIPPGIMDRQITGNYGEDAYGGEYCCESCWRPLTENTECYDIRGSLFCAGCTDAAAEKLFEVLGGDYMIRL